MKILIYVLLAVAAAAALAICVVVLRRRKSLKEKCLKAAGNVLREEFLDYSLRNRVFDNDSSQPRRSKTMLLVTSKSSGKKQSYVFDPELGIEIGREKNESNIFICDNKVSKKHCYIYSMNDAVYVFDYGSSNGTTLRRGLFNKTPLRKHIPEQVYDGDTLDVGAARLKIRLFDASGQY